MAYWESNGHVTDDVTWRERSRSWPQCAGENSELIGILAVHNYTTTL